MPQPMRVEADIFFSTGSLQASSRQVQQALGRITGQASEFQKSLDASTARVFAFGATTTVLQAVNQSFKKLVSTTIEVEKRLIEINSIFQATETQFNRFRNAIFQVAKDTGQAFGTVADGAAELARQGLSAEETAKRLEAALILTRISGIDAEKSVKALTAAINGFTSAGLSAEQIVNKIVAVDTAFAVSAQDLADGFSRAGSTAEDAGVSFDELLGLITAVEQRTARGGAVIGNAFKSIFTRLSRGSTIDDLKALGVEINQAQTGIQKLQALSSAIENISDPSVVNQIKELAGGVYQINVVSSTLKDLSSETSVFADAAKTAASATNEAFQKNELLNTSLAAQINSLVVSMTSFAEKVGNITLAPLFKNLVGIANTVSEALDKALDPEKGNAFIQGLFKAIGSFISGPGLILITTAFLKITMMIAKFAKEGFQAVLQIGSAQEQSKVIQEGIVRLLQHDVELRKALSNETLSQAQKEQAVLEAIKRENLLLFEQKRLLENITALAARKGIVGYNPQTGFSGKKGKAAGYLPNFASGFQQEEMMAQALGASARVQAHYGKGKIGGRKFIMNNEEIEIPNFGSNGDSAVIPKYAAGNKPEERKFFGPNQLPTILSPTGAEGIVKYSPKNAAVDLNFRALSVSSGEKKNLAEYFTKRYNIGNITKLLKNRAKQDVNKISHELGISPEKPANIGEIKNPSGFEGSVSAVMGSIFDSALSAMFASRSDNGLGGDFDIRNPSQEARKQIRLLFGENALRSGAPFDGVGDYKIDAFSKSSKESMWSKTMKELNVFANPMSQKQKNAEARRRSRAAFFAAKRGRATGFLPNFNAMNKGVPVSQIRAHFDPMGNPIAVTNTRDEPNGLKDAIGREKKGVGMAAHGFIPNFAKTQKTTKTSEDDLEDLGNTAAQTTNRLFALQGVIFGLTALTDTYSSSMQQTLSALQAEKEERIQAIQDNQKLSEDTKKKALEAVDKEYNARIESAEKITKSTNDMVSKINAALSTIQIVSTLDLASGGKIGKGVGKLAGAAGKTAIGASILAAFATASPLFISAFKAAAGPIGAAIAIGAGAYLIAKEVKGGFESKEKAKRIAISGDVMREGLASSTKAINIAAGSTKAGQSGTAKIAQMIKQLEKGGPSGQALANGLDRARQSVIESRGRNQKANQALADMVKNIEKTAPSLLKMQEAISNSKKSIISANAAILENRNIAVQNSQGAVETVSMFSGLRMPDGVAGQIMSRAMQGESAIAETNLARDELRKLESEGTGLDPKSAEGIEFAEKMKSATADFESKMRSSAVTLSNVIAENEAQIKSLNQTLENQRKQQVDDRFSFAGGLAGKTINVDTIRSDIQALKEADESGDEAKKAEVMQNIAEKRAGLEGPAAGLFDAIAKANGIDLNKVTEDSDKAVLRKATNGQLTEEEETAFLEQRKKQGPDIEGTERELGLLYVATQNAKERLEKFGEAFAEDGAAGIINQIKQMEANLKAVADGTKSSTEVLNKLNEVNDSALKLSEESDKKVNQAIRLVQHFDGAIKLLEARIDETIKSITGGAK